MIEDIWLFASVWFVCTRKCVCMNVNSLFYRSRHTRTHTRTRSVCYFDLLSASCLSAHRIQFDWNLSSILISIQYFSIRFRYLIHVIESCSIVPSCYSVWGSSADVGVSILAYERAPMPFHTMSNNRSWCWYVRNVQKEYYYSGENDDDDDDDVGNNSCNCDWIYISIINFSETVHSFDLYAFAHCECNVVVVVLIYSNASLAPLSILYMQTGWMTKSRMVMNGNGYRLARIAKCIKIKMEMEIELASIDVSCHGNLRQCVQCYIKSLETDKNGVHVYWWASKCT